VSILGNRVLRKEDVKFLTVGGTYVEDTPLQGAAWVVYVRSPFAHARITGVSTDAARSAPGVLDIVSASDLNLAPIPPGIPIINPAMARPPLAEGVVRFVGEPVVAVVAASRAEAQDAAELVEVDYDPLPAVVDVREALEGTTLLFPEAGTNVAFEMAPDLDESFFDGCEVVVRQSILNQRLAPCPLEVRSAAASWGEDGRVTLWVSSQAPFAVRASLAALLGVEESLVHVISPDVGGGFGSKGSNYPEELLTAVLAKRLGRPVRWTETRSESMLGLGHGRGQHQEVAIGGTRDGRVLAYRLEVIQESGAYPILGTILPTLTQLMASGTYDIPKIEFRSHSVVTNTTQTTAYRGAGRPEATSAIERAMDLFAAEIGMDPAEVRRRNLITADRFPVTTAAGATYDSGDYPKALATVLEAAGYDELRRQQAERRAEGGPLQLGIGVSTYVEITNGVPGPEFGSVEVLPDGRAVVKTGTSAHGQGHNTAWSMLVADTLGIPIENVEFIQSDTDLVKHGIGTFGSRSLQSGGVAAHKAATKVVEMAKEIAAELLEASPADLVVDKVEGGLQVAGTPIARRSWGEIAQAAADKGTRLLAEVDYEAGPSFPFGAHVAVVEVDTETGKVRLLRHVAVDDAGTILNPLLADGQVHGGIAQGAAQALLEEFRYDEEGNPLTTNLADYPFISATELPSFERIPMETPNPANELGAKGIGESGTIGATPAVQNAVVDALAHLGVRHVDMPATPERIWRAIHARG
jgi:carbon-monoxide dehydrogenase large subunit